MDVLNWTKCEGGYEAVSEVTSGHYRVERTPGRRFILYVEGEVSGKPATLADRKEVAGLLEVGRRGRIGAAHPGSDPMPGDGDDTVLEPTPLAPPEPVVPPAPEARVEGDGCYCVECLRKITPEALPGFLDDGMCRVCRSRGCHGAPRPLVAPTRPDPTPPPAVPLDGSLRSLVAGVASLAAWFVGRAIGAVAARARPAVAW